MKFSLNEEKIQLKIDENRDLLVPLGILSVAIVLFLVFILPAIFSFPSKKGERDVEVTRLNQIKESKRVLETSNGQELTSEVELVTRALPSDKNFELILSAISEAALNSNVQIASYIFSDSETSGPLAADSYAELAFKVSVIGGIAEASSFANELYSLSPISDVKSISYKNGISEVFVSFYYKPFTSVDAQDAALARDKNTEETSALEVISNWSTVSVEPEFINSTAATDSAEEDSVF